MKKKNLLLLINQHHGGGAEKAITSLSLGLTDHYHVIFVIYNKLEQTGYPHGGELVKIKLPYDTDTDKNPFHKRLIRFISLIVQLRRIKKRRQIDISLSFLEASNLVNVLSSRKEKLILSVRSFLSNELKDQYRLRIFRPVIRLLYNRAKWIVVPANLVKSDLVENFGVKPEKIHVIHNFIDKETLTHLAQQPLPEHHKEIFTHHPVLINVGRLSSPKAQWLLISLLKRIQHHLPATRLVILGDGSSKDRIIETSAQEGLAVYDETNTATVTPITGFDIFLLGHIDNPYPYLQKSSVFVLSSIYEGFPNVVIEAMACGLPVIASDCLSGPREILTDSSDAPSAIASAAEYAEYGILTPAFDRDKNNLEQYLEAACQAAIYLLGNEENRLYYRERSLSRANDFGKKQIMENWIHLIG